MGIKDTDIWGKSHTGYKRKRNEDRFIIKKISGITILVVADGMGGHVGGNLAAQIVIDTFQEYKFSEKALEINLSSALGKAQEKIFQEIKQNPVLDGMGTTATTAVLYKDKVFWIHIGDSRIYLLHNRRIKQITTDHTFIQDLIDDGTLSPEKARTHPLRNVLDQCLGCDQIEPDSGVFKVEKDDRLLLCSDGLTTHLSDIQIESILRMNLVQDAGQKLIKTALKMGGNDNVTVIVMEFY